MFAWLWAACWKSLSRPSIHINIIRYFFHTSVPVLGHTICRHTRSATNKHHEAFPFSCCYCKWAENLSFPTLDIEASLSWLAWVTGWCRIVSYVSYQNSFWLKNNQTVTDAKLDDNTARYMYMTVRQYNRTLKRNRSSFTVILIHLTSAIEWS